MKSISTIRCADCRLDDAGYCLHRRALILLASVPADPSLKDDPDTRRAILDVSRCGMHHRAKPPQLAGQPRTT